MLTSRERQDVCRLASALDRVLDAINDAGNTLLKCARAELPASAVETGAPVFGQCEHLHRAVMVLRASHITCHEYQEIGRLEGNAIQAVDQELERNTVLPSDDDLCDLYVMMALAAKAAEETARTLTEIVLPGKNTINESDYGSPHA